MYLCRVGHIMDQKCKCYRGYKYKVKQASPFTKQSNSTNCIDLWKQKTYEEKNKHP
jgi:hypothetical protein